MDYGKIRDEDRQRRHIESMRPADAVDPRVAIDLEDEHQSETEWLARVLKMLADYGWKVHHVFEQANYARRTDKGYPDISAVREGRHVYMELKAHGGHVTDDQVEWLDQLALAHREVYIARPRDSDAVHLVFENTSGLLDKLYIVKGILWKFARDAEIAASHLTDSGSRTAISAGQRRTSSRRTSRKKSAK